MRRPTPSPGPRRGRPPGRVDTRNAARARRRGVLAAAAVAGQPIAQVARSEGVSRSWASREAHSPETQVLIAQLLDRHLKLVQSLVRKALISIDEAFAARRTASVRAITVHKGKRVKEEDLVVDLGPDHFARLTATKRLIELAVAGRTIAEDDSSSRGLTMEALLHFRQRLG